MIKNNKFFLIIIFAFSLFFRLFKINNQSNLLLIILLSFIPIIIYFLIKEINQKAYKTAIIAAIIATINPYLIYFSRYNQEKIIFTLGLLMIFLFFFKYLNSKSKKYLFLSVFILAISVSYNLFFNNNSLNLNLFSYHRPQTEVQTIISEANHTDYYLFHNQPLFFLRNFSSRYFNYFSPRFLIFEGDWQNTQYSHPYIGVILYPSLIFLIIGFFVSLTRSKLDKLNIFFIFWLLLAPIPAALTQFSINSSLSLPLSIPLIYFISFGIYFVTNKYKSLILYYADLYLNHI